VESVDVEAKLERLKSRRVGEEEKKRRRREKRRQRQQGKLSQNFLIGKGRIGYLNGSLLLL
jgi:hypothetical protein